MARACYYQVSPKDFQVKLQACSKIVSLVVLGFTLTSGVAYYALEEQEKNLIEQTHTRLNSHLKSFGQESALYTKRVNDEYYDLVNTSLTQILALGSDYYKLDPLLSFYQSNLRQPSAYSSGEALEEALDALSYFRIPFVSYDFKTKELTVHNAQNDKHQERILKIHDKYDQPITELIAQKPYLNQSFNIMYFGSGTYLCLKIYDQEHQRNYYVLSSYLTTLENIRLDVKNIFSDLTPLMHQILDEQAVMIVRRNTPIFKTDNFDLNLDLENIDLKEIRGISLVDDHGNILTDLSNVPTDRQVSLLSVSYLKSINSFMLMQTPYNVLYPNQQNSMLLKAATIGTGAVFAILLVLMTLKLRRNIKKQQHNLSNFSDNLNSLTFQNYMSLYDQARAEAHKQLTEYQHSRLEAKEAALAEAKEQLIAKLRAEKAEQARLEAARLEAEKEAELDKLNSSENSTQGEDEDKAFAQKECSESDTKVEKVLELPETSAETSSENTNAESGDEISPKSAKARRKERRNKRKNRNKAQNIESSEEDSGDKVSASNEAVLLPQSGTVSLDKDEYKDPSLTLDKTKASSQEPANLQVKPTAQQDVSLGTKEEKDTVSNLDAVRDDILPPPGATEPVPAQDGPNLDNLNLANITIAEAMAMHAAATGEQLVLPDQDQQDKQDESADKASSLAQENSLKQENASDSASTEEQLDKDKQEEEDFEIDQATLEAMIDPKLLKDDESLMNEHELTTELMLQAFFKRLPQDTEEQPKLETQVLQSLFKVLEGLNTEYTNKTEQTIEQARADLKSRIPLYRKEGKCLATRQVLLSALPDENAMPESNFVDFAAFTVPARDLSGNFYTLKRIDDDNLVFIMGDCDATGVKAAYTVAVVTTMLQEALKLFQSPCEILDYINQRLCATSQVSPVAMFVGIISEKTGNVIAANAGHCVPLLIDDQGPHFVDETASDKLGITPDQSFTQIKWYQANDDMVILYSQGILNVRNAEDQIFGMPRLLEHCTATNNLRADEMVIRILNDLKEHKGKRPFRQDVSLICLKQLLIRF